MSGLHRPPVLSDPLPSDALRQRVLAAVRAEPVGTRVAGVRRRTLLIAAVLVFSACLSVALGRPGLSGRPLSYVVSLALAWALVGAAATWAGVARGRSMLGRTPRWRMASATLTPVALVVASLAFGSLWPSTLADSAGIHAHLSCLVVTMAFALAPLATFIALRRASDPLAPRITGAAIAASAGAWGALGIELHCRHTSSFHVLLGHVLPVVLLALFGAAVGGWLLAIRAENR